MNEVPDLKEELERKSIEALEWLMHASSTHQISPSELKTAMQTWFWVTSGLLGEDVASLAVEVGANAGAKETRREVFIKGEKTLVITWTFGDKEIHIVEIVSGLVTERTAQADDPSLAHEKFEILLKTLVSKSGFKRV